MAGYYKKTESGNYRLFASGGTGPGGSRKRLTKTVEAKSDREAEKLLAKFVAEVEKGEYIEPSKMTFADFAERWFQEKEKNLAPRTAFRYTRILKARLIPAFGHLKLEDIKPLHILDFRSNIEEDGIREDGKPGKLSSATIFKHMCVLSSIFKTAVKWKLIPFNPAEGIEPPKVKQQRAVCYDEEQTAALLAALQQEPLKYQVLVTLALFTGLRRGELMGLEWKDVDFEKGTLDVRQTSQYVAGKGAFTKEPKTETSKRLLSVPAPVLTLLKQHKASQNEDRLKCGDAWIDSDRIFTKWNGTPTHPEFPTQWFPKFLKKYELPHIPFHGLRHTAATMLINQNLPAKSISSRMGHANIGVTMDVYGHYLKSADKEAADRLSQVYDSMMDNGKKDIKKGRA